MAVIFVLVTVSNTREGEKMAKALVKERRVACVNIVPKVNSIYRWKGKVEKGSETLLIMKTLGSCFPGLSRRIKQLHSYDVPEILTFPVKKGNSEYLAWVKDSVR